jgi:hypothetical protein
MVVSEFEPRRHEGTEEHSVISFIISTVDLRVTVSLWFKR